MDTIHIQFKINDSLYLKDPDTSVLGRKILSKSIELIDELGFKSFTFKKLGAEIGSPESTIYRYFENKQNLLIYLTSWYWSWVEYRLMLSTINIDDANKRLHNALKVLTHPVEMDTSFSHINEVLLNKIIVSESVKIFYTKNVDDNCKKGFFNVYEQIINRVSEMILAVNPTYKFPYMLVTSILRSVQNQRYFLDHLPQLTDKSINSEDISTFYEDLLFKAIVKND